MAIYSFEDVKTGEAHELHFGMSEVPDFGETVRRKGRTLKRVFETSHTPPVVAGDFYTNYQCATGTEESSGAKHYDKEGRPMFTSRREAREWASKKSGEGYGTKFDG